LGSYSCGKQILSAFKSVCGQSSILDTDNNISMKDKKISSGKEVPI